jgi:hypothetical protein
VKVGLKMNKEVMWSSSRHWLGQRRLGDRRRWWDTSRKMAAKTTGSHQRCGRRLGSRSASTVEDVEAEVSTGLDGNWRAWWRPAMANSAPAARASRAGDGVREEEGKVKRYFSPVVKARG